MAGTTGDYVGRGLINMFFGGDGTKDINPLAGTQQYSPDEYHKQAVLGYMQDYNNGLPPDNQLKSFNDAETAFKQKYPDYQKPTKSIWIDPSGNDVSDKFNAMDSSTRNMAMYAPYNSVGLIKRNFTPIGQQEEEANMEALLYPGQQLAQNAVHNLVGGRNFQTAQPYMPTPLMNVKSPEAGYQLTGGNNTAGAVANEGLALGNTLRGVPDTLSQTQAIQAGTGLNEAQFQQQQQAQAHRIAARQQDLDERRITNIAPLQYDHELSAWEAANGRQADENAKDAIIAKIQRSNAGFEQSQLPTTQGTQANINYMDLGKSAQGRADLPLDMGTMQRLSQWGNIMSQYPTTEIGARIAMMNYMHDHPPGSTPTTTLSTGKVIATPSNENKPFVGSAYRGLSAPPSLSYDLNGVPTPSQQTTNTTDTASPPPKEDTQLNKDYTRIIPETIGPSTSNGWDRFRNSNSGRSLFGPTEMELEARPDMENRGLVPILNGLSMMIPGLGQYGTLTKAAKARKALAMANIVYH